VNNTSFVFLVTGTSVPEDFYPGIFRIRQHDRNEVLEFVLRRIDRDNLLLAGRNLPLSGLLHDQARINAEELRDQGNDDHTHAATGYSTGHSCAAPVFDVLATPAVLPKHRASSYSSIGSLP
jgi:hypothetical protein